MSRSLDETIVANLNSIIDSNNEVVISIFCYFNTISVVFYSKLIFFFLLQVVTLLRDNDTFTKELFARLKSPTASIESKKKLVNVNTWLTFLCICKAHGFGLVACAIATIKLQCATGSIVMSEIMIAFNRCTSSPRTNYISFLEEILNIALLKNKDSLFGVCHFNIQEIHQSCKL